MTFKFFMFFAPGSITWLHKLCRQPKNKACIANIFRKIELDCGKRGFLLSCKSSSVFAWIALVRCFFWVGGVGWGFVTLTYFRTAIQNQHPHYLTTSVATAPPKNYINYNWFNRLCMHAFLWFIFSILGYKCYPFIIHWHKH